MPERLRRKYVFFSVMGDSAKVMRVDYRTALKAYGASGHGAIYGFLTPQKAVVIKEK